VIRRSDFTPADAPATHRLFRDTVRAINSRDYTPEQVAAWAPEGMDETSWREHFVGTITVVAESDGGVVGFANLDADDHLDCLYVHHCHQGEGIGTLLLKRLEALSRERGARQLSSEVSITARPPLRVAASKYRSIPFVTLKSHNS